MVATLPGRTHGLGLVTEPLLRDFGLDHVTFGQINLWTTLLGAAFCLPAGWLVDWLGLRATAAIVVTALAAVVLAMAAVHAVWLLAGLVLLSRGLGQSALSVVSLGIAGKTPLRRRGVAMGVFAFLTGVGSAIAIQAAKSAEEGLGLDWRGVWSGVGWVLFLAVMPACWLVRESAGPATESVEESAGTDWSVLAALRTPAFWAFGLATAFYALVSTGLMLFGEAVLVELGLGHGDFLDVLSATFLFGVVFNLLCGWLAQRWPAGRVMAFGLFALAAALLALPYLRSPRLVLLYAALAAFTGGAVMVVFFAVWRQLFGPTHLGRIQGAAQTLTVLGTAAGPLVFATYQDRYGSFAGLYPSLALVAVVLGAWAWLAPLPVRPAPATVAAAP
jgi:MFS family permease